MRILLLTQYFPPETGAPQNRLADIADRLATLGHNVTVLTALPNYPQGEIFREYRGRFIVNEKRNNIRVVRTWLFATRSKGFAPKIANYLSFAILSSFVGLIAVKRPDIVFVESPPIFLAISGFFLAKMKRAKLLLNISDLWPESAVALGVLRSPRLIRWSEWLETALYRGADLVTGQTQGIIDGVRKRWPAAPRALLTNGVAPEFLLKVDAARPTRPQIRKELGFGNVLVVAYTGVHGLSQGLETIVRAAELLAANKEIKFIFFGDGPEKPGLEAIAASKHLANVHFFPPQPSARMADILVSIDVAIVPLKRADLFKGAIPSKLFEALGSGVPVIAAVEGEARKLVDLSGGGLVVEPENSEEMASAIVRLLLDENLRQELGRNGRNYVAKHYSRKTIAKQFEKLLLAVKSSTLTVSEDGSVHPDYAAQDAQFAASEAIESRR